MIPSFRTDKSEQTVQTQISLIRVYTVCHSVCIVWTHYSMVEPHSSNFRVITTNFLCVRIFMKFMVTAKIKCSCQSPDQTATSSSLGRSSLIRSGSKPFAQTCPNTMSCLPTPSYKTTWATTRPRLIWVFAERTLILLILLCCGS